MSKKQSKVSAKHIHTRGEIVSDGSDDDHSQSGRGSSSSPENYSDSGNSSAGQNQTIGSTSPHNTSIGEGTLKQGTRSFVYIYIYI